MNSRWRWAAVTAAVVLVSAWAALVRSPVPEGRLGPRPEPPRLPPVALDPGHGGIDGGAHAAGVLEKNLTLPITLELAARLRQAGCPVVLTRETDIALDPASYAGDLRRRQEIAIDSGATALLAVHVDSIGTPSARGTLVLYPLGDSPGRARSRALAEAIHASLKEAFPDGRHSLRESDIPYLVESQVPAVLVEVGFISNPEERRLLTDPQYQKRLAAALAAGVLAFRRAADS